MKKRETLTDIVKSIISWMNSGSRPERGLASTYAVTKKVTKPCQVKHNQTYQ